MQPVSTADTGCTFHLSKHLIEFPCDRYIVVCKYRNTFYGSVHVSTEFSIRKKPKLLSSLSLVLTVLFFTETLIIA